jgi:hypothetical protein
MVVEYPWMRDALTRRLRNFVPEGLPFANDTRDSTARGDRGAAPVLCLGESGPGATADVVNELHAFLDPKSSTPRDVVVDLSKVDEAPLWLLGTLVSYQVALQRQGRQMRLTGIRPETDSGPVLQRLSDRFEAAAV